MDVVIYFEVSFELEGDSLDVTGYFFKMSFIIQGITTFIFCSLCKTLVILTVGPLE